MKTAAKVFIILGMIGGAIGIVPIIVGAIALKKMKEGKPSVAMSVVTLIFCSPLAGLFLLLSKPEDYEPAQQ